MKGTLRLASAKWKMGRGTLQLASAKWKMGRGTLQLASAKWKMGRGTLRIASAKWKMGRGKLKYAYAKWKMGQNPTHERVAQFAAQAAVQANSIGTEHRAPRRAPPQDRLAFGKPREDAAAVGIEETSGREVATEGQQAVGFGEGVRDRWKWRVGIVSELNDAQAHVAAARNGECACNCTS